MKHMTTTVLLLSLALLVLLDIFWLHPRTAIAQGQLKVYVQRVRDKHWTEIQGTEIVGFSCGPVAHANGTECFVASR
jgi:hypothetical protein